MRIMANEGQAATRGFTRKGKHVKRLTRSLGVAAVSAVLCATGANAQSDWISVRDSSWPNGNTVGSTYTIHTAEQLAQFAWMVNQNDQGSRFMGKTIQLMANIDLSARPWTPIGVYGGGSDEFQQGFPFTGTFDGNGKTINGMRINESSSSRVNAGFFRNLIEPNGYSPNVRRIRFTNAQVQATSSGGTAYVGCVAGVAGAGLIEDCIVEGGTVSAGGSAVVYAGGIAGSHEAAEGIIRNCVNAAQVQVSGGISCYGGGIAGNQRSTSVQNCLNMGTVLAVTKGSMLTGLGGISGSTGIFPSGSALIENCFNTGTVVQSGNLTTTPTVYAVGALAGYAQSNPTLAIINSYWMPGTAQQPLGGANGMSNPAPVANSVVSVGPAPGAVSSEALETVLNRWVTSKGPASYRFWSVIPGMNYGYPTLTDIAAMGSVLVTFDYNGATSGNATPSKTVIPGAFYGPLPNPGKGGYTFGGWYLTLAFTPPAVDEQTRVAASSAHTLYAQWTPVIPGFIAVPDTSTPDPDDYFTFNPDDPNVHYPSDKYGNDLVDVGVGTGIGHIPAEDGDGYPFTVPEVPGYPDDEYDYVFNPDIPAVLVIDPDSGKTNAVIHVPSGVIDILDPDTGDVILILVPDTSTPDPDDYFTFNPDDPNVNVPSDKYGDGLVDVAPGVDIGHIPTDEDDGYPFTVPEVPGCSTNDYDYVFDPSIPAVIVIDKETGTTNVVIRVPSEGEEGKEDIDWQWLTVGEIQVLTDGTGNVLLAWPQKQVILYGRYKYVVYSDEDLTTPLISWTPFDERDSQRNADKIKIQRSLTVGGALWDRATLLEQGTDPKRFFKVKAVRY